MMKKLSLLTLLLLLTACGSTQKVNKAELKKVKKVAFVIYSVPEYIKFREDPRENKAPDSLWDMAKKAVAEATKGEGDVASDVSYDKFIAGLNKSKKLGFKVMTKKELLRNKKFMAIVEKYRPEEVETPVVEESSASKWIGKIASLTGSNEDKTISRGPKHLPTFGLITRWGSGKALLGSKEEKAYVNEVLKALDVDAILAVNDMGYSFACKACVAGTGAATTGSAFHASLVGRDGKTLMDMNQWFSYTSDETPTTAGIVNPSSQKELFSAHGEKLAKVFVDQYEESILEE